MTFGQWLKVEREAADLSQEQLAHELGCTRNTIHNIETGRTDPRYAIQKRALEFFGVALPWNPISRVLFDPIVAQSPGTGTYG